MSQDVSCDTETGHKTFHRDGSRDGSRIGSHIGTRSGDRISSRAGSREGTRTGSRAGALNGSISYAVNYDPRQANQFTGFILKGLTGAPKFTASGDPVWNAPTFGDYTFAHQGRGLHHSELIRQLPSNYRVVFILNVSL
jgi:hypothetical protein